MTVTVLHLDTYREGGWFDPHAGGWMLEQVRMLRESPAEELVAAGLEADLYVAVAKVEGDAEDARLATQNPGGPLTGWSRQQRANVTVLGRGYFETHPGDEQSRELAYRRSWNGDLMVDGERVYLVKGDRLELLSLKAPDLSAIPDIDATEDAPAPTL